MTTTNNYAALETGFYKNLGDGVKAADFLLQIMEATVASRDTTILSKAIFRAESEKKDKVAANLVRFVTGKVFPSAKVKTDKASGRITIKIAGIEPDADAIGRLRTAVASGYSIRGTNFKKALLPEQEEEKALDVQAWAARVKKQHGENLDAMIAALQAVRG